MDFAFAAEAGLAGLFLASFLAATLLPGGSEAVLAALLLTHPEQAAAAVLLATAGNTLGGMTTYALGRLLPQKVGAGDTADTAAANAGAVPDRRHLATLNRWGPPALLLAWAPLVGDALCAAAGWLRLNWISCAAWMAAGKGTRYAFIAWAL